ncbi:MAG: SusC/RagA family TonB-linked outer membrane protein, partial [Muribaculaceae bacterium]|nr:SusC/RagA family TonB-linked outer membrane protein [Muribaculaceae bacterium]
GYGSGKKLGSMVGSVSVVGSEALENVTTPSFLDALQGKVAGLSIMSDSGDPSSTENQVRMRGVNSLNSSVTPLFILDGAPITQTVFSTLNPSDIESITVLKDAASVAIYGSRAANGVIVITSKKGKYAEKATVSIRAKYGWSQMTSDKTEMMNSAQYIQYRDLIGQPVGDDQRAAWEKYGIDTDWRAETFNGHAPTYSLDASVTGGSEASNYYLSLNHLDQDGIIEQSQMRRDALRVSVSSRAANWLRVGFNANLGYTKYEQNNESNAIYDGDGIYTANPMVFARRAMPMDSPNYYTIGEDGNIIWGEKALFLHYTGMPTPHYFNQQRSVWNNRVTINANIFEEITPINGLTLRAQQAVDAYDQRREVYNYANEPLYTPMGDTYGTDDVNSSGVIEGSAGQSFGRYYQFTYTNTAEYRFKINNIHNITLLAGEESIISKSNSFGVSSSGQSDRRLPLLQQGDASTFSGSHSISQLAMNSFFFSGSYNYEDKYFVDANFRTDGSSRFAPGHRWAQFWSAGVMWDLKQENFLKKLTWFNKARLRVSYGTTGNSSFANYAYFGLVGSGRGYNGESSL